jgi:hypothetical protein
MRFSALESSGVHPINQVSNCLLRERFLVEIAAFGQAFFELSVKYSWEVLGMVTYELLRQFPSLDWLLETERELDCRSRCHIA